MKFTKLYFLIAIILVLTGSADAKLSRRMKIGNPEEGARKFLIILSRLSSENVCILHEKEKKTLNNKLAELQGPLNDTGKTENNKENSAPKIPFNVDEVEKIKNRLSEKVYPDLKGSRSWTEFDAIIKNKDITFYAVKKRKLCCGFKALVG